MAQDRDKVLEAHYERHLRLAGELGKAKGKSVSAAIAEIRSGLMSDHKGKVRLGSQAIMNGFGARMRKARGEI